MLTQSIILLTFLSAFFQPLFAVVFLTHGAQIVEKRWHMPTGVFHQELQKSAAKKGHEVRGYVWDYSVLGGTSNVEHFVAGLGLAAKIIEFCKDAHIKRSDDNAEIIVLGHSYGGLVAYYASIVLAAFQKPEKMKKLLALCKTCELSIDQQTTCQRVRELINWFMQAITWKWFKTKPVPVISKIITMGTPHFPGRFPIPDSNGVLSIYNFFSHDDTIANQSRYYSAGTPLLWSDEFTNPIRHIELVGNNVPVSHTKFVHPTIAATILDMVEADGNKYRVDIDSPMPADVGTSSDDYLKILREMYCRKVLFIANRFATRTHTAWSDIRQRLV